MFFKDRGGAQWLVVFLGNPGPKYAATRHNAGFMAAAAMEKLKNIRINRARFRALTGMVEIGGQKVMLMMPQTFMNLSGEAAVQAVRFYKIPSERVIVVSDEMALPVGNIRVKTSGSAGGHNGLKSIISCLGTDKFPRIRIGVGEVPHPDYDQVDWVMSTFKNQDAKDIAEAAKRAAEAVESYILDGPDKTMSRFNSKVR